MIHCRCGQWTEKVHVCIEEWVTSGGRGRGSCLCMRIRSTGRVRVLREKGGDLVRLSGDVTIITITAEREEYYHPSFQRIRVKTER